MSNRLGQRATILGGTLFGLIGNITPEDLLRTAILAALGTIVSYGVTVVMKRIGRGKR
jgi:hypothetical protein